MCNRKSMHACASALLMVCSKTSICHVLMAPLPDLQWSGNQRDATCTHIHQQNAQVHKVDQAYAKRTALVVSKSIWQGILPPTATVLRKPAASRACPLSVRSARREYEAALYRWKINLQHLPGKNCYNKRQQLHSSTHAQVC